MPWWFVEVLTGVWFGLGKKVKEVKKKQTPPPAAAAKPKGNNTGE